MDNIYFNCILTKKIIVEARYLNENIDNYIENYIKTKVEGCCVDEGYIKPDTVKILKKSVGMLLGSRFTGDVTYEIAYTASVCNPMIGNIIDCKVKFVNKLGLLGNNGPITIIIGKQFHVNDDELNKINENDTVKVEVIAKKFYLNDKEIKIIAKLWNENDKKENVNKKELVSSDLTPVNDNDEEYNQLFYNNEEQGINGAEDEEDAEDAEEVINVENPDENNLEADDIELDDDEEEDDYDEDVESTTEYE